VLDEESSSLRKHRYHLKIRQGIAEMEKTALEGGLSSHVGNLENISTLQRKSFLSHAEEKVKREINMGEAKNHCRGP
jgi:hypothetical protein